MYFFRLKSLSTGQKSFLNRSRILYRRFRKLLLMLIKTSCLVKTENKCLKASHLEKRSILWKFSTKSYNLMSFLKLMRLRSKFNFTSWIIFKTKETTKELCNLLNFWQILTSLQEEKKG
jgi:hypothetical protein